MFISSLLDERYKWFYDDLLKSEKIQFMMIEESNFDTMVGFFRTACIKRGLNKDVVVRFSMFLIAVKEYLCIVPGSQNLPAQQQEML